VTIPTPSRFSLHSGGSSSFDDRPISASPLHAIARVLLVLTLCAAPWAFGAVEAWGWGTLMVLSLLTLILWAGGCAHRGVLKICWSPLYGPFLAFLLLAVIQLIAGLNADHVATREAVLKLVTNLVFFFLAGQLLNAQPENGQSLVWLGLIVTLSAFALSILGLAQLFWGVGPRVIYWTIPVTGWPFGPYVNHNNYAGLMEMFLPISAAYILSRSLDPILRFLLWSGVMMVIISVWISGSRGGAGVLLIEGLILAGILLRYRSRHVPHRSFFALAGVVLVSAVIFSWMVSTGRVGGRAWEVFQNNSSLEAKLGDRFRVGIDTLHMARSHPWMGVGVGCFEYVFPNYTTFSTDLHWTHAHDDILEAASETGFPGVALMLVALVLFSWMAFRHLGERLRHGWGWIQMGAAVGAVGLLCHSFVDFNLRIPANAAWFVVCVAIATHPGPAPEDPPKIVWESSSDRSSEFLT
jgi:O-antigen ligase